MNSKLVGLAMLVSVHSSAFAAPAFQNVTGKLCDGKPVAIENGERVLMGIDAGMIALGRTLANGCVVADFHTVILTGSTSINGVVSTVVTASGLVAQEKSTCSKNLTDVPSQFESANYTPGELDLVGTKSCRLLRLKLEQTK